MTIWPSHELCYPCAPCSSQIPCNPGISQCCERGPHTERAGTFPSLSLESGGKRVYMMKSFGSLSYSIDNKAEMTFSCVYLHMHEWFISKPPEMLQKTSSSLYPLTQSEQTVSANCCLFRDVSVLLRQHWRRLSTHRCSKVQQDYCMKKPIHTYIPAQDRQDLVPLFERSECVLVGHDIISSLLCIKVPQLHFTRWCTVDVSTY